MAHDYLFYPNPTIYCLTISSTPAYVGVDCGALLAMTDPCSQCGLAQQMGFPDDDVTTCPQRVHGETWFCQSLYLLHITGDCSHIVLSLKTSKLACKWQHQDKHEGECTIHLGCVIAGAGHPAIDCRVIVGGPGYEDWNPDLKFPIRVVQDVIFTRGQCRGDMHITVYGSSWFIILACLLH